MKWQSLRIALIMVATILFISASAMTTGKAAPGEAIPTASSDSLPGVPSTTTQAQDSGLERIRFAPGATSALASGDLPARSSARYVLRAMVGQLMEVDLSAPQGTSLLVTTAAGRVLTPITGGSTSFRGYLPRNGDYIIKVSSGIQAVSYSVYVSIPQRVAFERGTTSIALQGHVDAHQSHDYILRAMAGQLMEIDITPENSLQLIIYGVDGSVLRSGMGEGSSFRGELPLSEDYVVTVRAGDQAVSYTMNVIIPQRITFRRGAISATVRGTVSAFQSQYYVLRALKNQTMRVNVTSSEDVQLIIYGADGTVLKSGMGEGASFRGELPSTQDYILIVRAGADAGAYSLRVTIR